MTVDALFASYGNLPGAPPASDTAAWAPAGGPQGATPDAAPLRDVPFDPDTLTPVQRHQMRQAIRSGSQAEYQRFLDGLNAGQPNTAPSADLAPPVEGEGVVPGFELDASPQRRAMAEKLAESGSSIEMIDTLEGPVSKFTDRLAALPDDAARHAAIFEGEQQVIARLFRGDEGRFKHALTEIRDAALAIGGADLVKGIDDSAALSDPQLFERIWLMANVINQNRKP